MTITGPWLASYVVLWIVMLVQGFVLILLVRQVGVLHLRLLPAGARTTNVGPEIGARLPELQMEDIQGNSVMVIGNERPRLLLFVAPPCTACKEMLPAAKTIARSEGARLDVLLLSAFEDLEANRLYVQSNGLTDLPYIVSPALAQEYGVLGTPYALAVDAGGVVQAKGIVNHIEHLESLVEALAHGQATVDDYAATQRGRGEYAT